jgi:hypothetical protein
MKTYLLSLTAASALVGVTAFGFRGAGTDVDTSRTVSAIHSSAQLDRTTKALTAYVNACADADISRLQSTLTDDAAIELPFAQPGTFFVVDNVNAADFCNTNGASGHVTSLHVYPAGEHAMFASFAQADGKPHLIMIEMRGSHILRLRDFTADNERVKRFAAGAPRSTSKEPS